MGNPWRSARRIVQKCIAQSDRDSHQKKDASLPAISYRTSLDTRDPWPARSGCRPRLVPAPCSEVVPPIPGRTLHRSGFRVF